MLADLRQHTRHLEVLANPRETIPEQAIRRDVIQQWSERTRNSRTAGQRSILGAKIRSDVLVPEQIFAWLLAHRTQGENTRPVPNRAHGRLRARHLFPLLVGAGCS